MVIADGLLHSASMIVDAELTYPFATIDIVRLAMPKPVRSIVHEERAFRLDLALKPRVRGTSLCLKNRWEPHRFETPGRLYFLPPGEVVKVKTGIGETESIVCHLSAEIFNEKFYREFEWTDDRVQAAMDVRSADIIDLLLKFGDEARSPGFASEVIAEAFSMQIAVNLRRHFEGVRGEVGASPLPAWRLRIIEERLEDSLEAPTLRELATLCRISVRQLSRGFRASRGVSIGNYIAQNRLEKAKGLLKNHVPVKNIYAQLGFGSVSSFCYAFKRSTGMTPIEFQRG